MRGSSLILSSVFALSACAGGGGAGGGTVLAPDWQNDGGKSISAVFAKVQSSPPPAGVAVAVGVTKDSLVGASLDGSGRWTHAGRPDTLPIVTGDVVVASSGGQVFALDAKSGKQLWSVPAEGRVVRGAGDDGTTTVVALGNATGGNSALLAVTRDGSVKQNLDLAQDIGEPAAQGNVAFVPWGSQYVSAIDLGSGKETGRLLLREAVSHAVNLGGQLYFGELGLTRFDQQIGQAAQSGASAVRLPDRELPGKPVWFTAGTDATPAAATAREKIRLYARPVQQGGKLGIAGGHYAATYFRVVMGLDSSGGALRWVKTFPTDVLGGAAAVNGFAFCNASGKVTLVDSSGGESGQVELGSPLVGCAVQVAGMEVSPGKPVESLPTQVASAIQVRETQMATAQKFLLRELGAMQNPLVTKALVELASNPRTPSVLLEDARKLLAARRDGAEYMLAALEQHYDFLGDVLRTPPVGPMADALAAMNETRAAAPLAHHLNDAANSADDIEHAAMALAKLATKSEQGDLETFFALYRATADQKELVNAVLSVAKALVRIGGDEGKRLVAQAAADPLTHPDVRAGLANLAPAKASEPKKGDAPAPAAAKADAKKG